MVTLTLITTIVIAILSIGIGLAVLYTAITERDDLISYLIGLTVILNGAATIALLLERNALIHGG